ncbi:hypothetical protein IT568_03300 [bacterium]|nr:hypothetical protein [bacterium]
MKTFVKMLTFLSLATSVFAAQRIVLVEEGTSSTCGPCASNNPTIQTAVEQLGQGTVLFLTYHAWWPSPGNDPMYLHNTSEAQTRIQSYYSINGIPDLITNGVNTPAQPWSNSSLTNGWFTAASVPAPVTIEAFYSIQNGLINVFGEVALDAGFSVSNDLKVRIAVIEQEINYATPPGTNGETTFKGVFRKFMPDANGLTANLNAGNFTFNETIPVNSVWNVSQLQLYVWVQDDATKAVHNSALAAPNAAPNNFEFVSPAFNSNLSGNQPVNFSWTQAIDPNPGDVIVYELNYDTDATFTTPITVPNLQTTL